MQKVKMKMKMKRKKKQYVELIRSRIDNSQMIIKSEMMEDL